MGCGGCHRDGARCTIGSRLSYGSWNDAPESRSLLQGRFTIKNLELLGLHPDSLQRWTGGDVRYHLRHRGYTSV